MKAVLIFGATAVAKSQVALRLAEEFGGELVEADSMQIYRGMNIGTAKNMDFDLRKRVPHHMIDIVEPTEKYSVARFVQEAKQCFHAIQKRKRNIFVVGGTGLYVQSLLRGLFSICVSSCELLRKKLLQEAQFSSKRVWNKLLAVDPEVAHRMHPNNIKGTVRALEVYYVTGKPISEHWRQHEESLKRGESEMSEMQYFKIWLRRPRDELRHRISKRCEKMVKDGLLDEIRGLLGAGCLPEHQSMSGIGYSHGIKVLSGEWNLEEMQEKYRRDSHRLAKRQNLFFRHLPVDYIGHPDECFEDLKGKIALFLNM